MNKKRHLINLFIWIIVVACTTEKIERIELDGTRWKLTELDGHGLIPDSGITLLFEDGKSFGSAGCNHYGGKYTTTPDSGFMINEIEKNVMLCLEPPGVMEQEDQYIATFARIRRFRVLDSELQFVDEGGTAILRFASWPNFADVSPEDLVGKTWQLVSAPQMESVDLSKFTIVFDGSSFAGTTTCRDYGGTYMAVKDRLNISFIEMTTDVACEEAMLMAEGWFTTLLENIEQYNVLESQMELCTLKGEKLVFELADR
jgi:heat shock protein HslJ